MQKSCETCMYMYISSNEPVDDDLVCCCSSHGKYLCYPEDAKNEAACKEWHEKES